MSGLVLEPRGPRRAGKPPFAWHHRQGHNHHLTTYWHVYALRRCGDDRHVCSRHACCPRQLPAARHAALRTCVAPMAHAHGASAPGANLQPHPLYNVWVPFPQERQGYWELFVAASAGGNVGGVPAVSGAQGAAFLVRSGLPGAVLKQVRARCGAVAPRSSQRRVRSAGAGRASCLVCGAPRAPDPSSTTAPPRAEPLASVRCPAPCAGVGPV